LVLASLFAVNGLPVFSASNTVASDRQTVLQDWANALGMSGDLGRDEISALEYWGTGTLSLHGQPCVLTDYHASIKYQLPGMRVEFTCVDPTGHAHHEIQVVAGKSAWNEAEPGIGSTSAMAALEPRLIALWTGPVALVKAAAAAGAQTHFSGMGGRTVVTFPVPGVADATVKATLSARHQAEHVETRLGDGTLLQTTYANYTELNGSDLRFDTLFPRRIVQRQGDVTLLDLTVTRTSTSHVDLVLQGSATVAQVAPATVTAPLPAAAVRAPKTWKDKQAFAKLDGSLRQTVAGGCVTPPSVIIRTKPGYRAGLRASLTTHGDQLSGEFPIINAVGATVSCTDLETLASFDSTLSVSVNARVMTTQVADPLATPPVALPVPTPDPAAAPAVTPDATPAADVVAPRDAEGQAAAALQAPMLQTLLGDNYEALRNQAPVNGAMGIAIIDSGIEPGPDFGDRITAFYDFTQGDVQAATPSDAYGHGTHVAGLAASRYVGVDPHARLIGLKVLNGLGQGSADAVLRAVEFAVVNKDLLNIQVLNLSLGHPIYEHAATDPLVQAVESAVRSGLVVVVSAGNLGLNPRTGQPGYGGIVSPGNAPSAFAIGAVRTHNTATRDDDQIALFSSRGPTAYDGFAKPDFSAPGQNLLSVAALGSTLRTAEEAKGNTGNYMRLNGTSMAAGVVSGVAALVLQANPTLTPNALKAVLEFSAIDVQNLTLTGSADFLTQGAGEISGGALALAQSIDTTAPAGANWLTSAVAPSTLINGESMPWVQQMIWANHLARGTDLLARQRSAWASDTVWGNSFDSGDNIVWGNSLDDNIVWGNSLSGDNIVWGNSLDDNIVWGNSLDDNIVWGNSLDDNIVWGNSLDDNIVWGNSVAMGGVN
jgi:serine protease AprX